MQLNDLQLELTQAPIATITLNKAEKHNAFDEKFLQELLKVLQALAQEQHVRVVILQAKGPSFCAGADLNWMQRMLNFTLEQNIEDARLLAEVMSALYSLPKPTIALVEGNAFGGGLGLIACCDLAFCNPGVKFALSEAKVGLLPAVISPYVINAIGARQASRYFLTAETFNAEKAFALGLVHEISDNVKLLAEQFCTKLLANSPQALAQSKALIARVAKSQIDAQLINDTIQSIAHIRVSAQAQEGLNAFLEKRQPDWNRF